jgi:tetratricopeptide (TPR) repeat protein
MLVSSESLLEFNAVEAKVRKSINTKLESLAYLLPVPLVIYFTTIASVIEDVIDIQFVILVGIMAGCSVLIPGLIWRIIALKKAIRIIRGFYYPDSEDSLPAGMEEAKKAKNLLLRFPLYEGLLVVAKWLIGLPLAHILFVIFRHPIPEAHWTIPFLLPTVIPISYVLFFFITENSIRPLLKTPEVANIPLPIKEVKTSNTFTRISLVNLSLVLLPSMILGYLIYLSVSGKLQGVNMIFHMAIIVGFGSTAVIIASYSVAKGIKEGLEGIKESLERLGSGDLDVTCAVTSADEFGEQAYATGIILNQLKDSYEEIQELNRDLEHKVQERTKELQTTLDQVRTLKTQQDGDYFLTSLLLNPLNVNKASQGNVNVDFVLKQKKEFEFRNRKQEIGGDFCLSQTVTLEGRPFTFFLNADAMGKSMQGAGGALILGSVTHTLLEKIKDDPHQNADRWLKKAFIDLHKIFETFNGSMLVSLIMGLVDEDSGTLSYLNAEHPWMVLFRDKKAQFIEKELLYRKLGTTGMEGRLEIQKFQLQPGDIVFAGSDGKDDILMKSVNGSDIVLNEDEELFLEVVEKADGNLANILQEIYNSGETKDDLSILRIAFQEKATVTGRSNSQKLSRYLQQAKSLLVDNKFTEAIHALNEAHLIDPKRADILKSLFRVYIKTKDFGKAIDSAERYLHIVPDDAHFLFQTSICYRRLGELENAKNFLEKAKEINPGLIEELLSDG